MSTSLESLVRKGDLLLWNKLQLSRGQIILDVGFGDTNELLALSKLVGSQGVVYGVELEKKRTDMMTVELPDSDNVRVIAGRAERLSLPNESVDVVLFKGGLHEIRNICQALAEARRVCKGNGIIFVLDFAPFPLRWLRVSNLQRRFKHPTKFLSQSLDKHPGFSKADFSSCIGEVGLLLESYEDNVLKGRFRGVRIPMFLAKVTKMI